MVYYSLRNNDCQGYLTAYLVEQNKFVWVRKHNRVISELKIQRDSMSQFGKLLRVICIQKQWKQIYQKTIVVISEELEFWCCIIFL